MGLCDLEQVQTASIPVEFSTLCADILPPPQDIAAAESLHLQRPSFDRLIRSLDVPTDGRSYRRLTQGFVGASNRVHFRQVVQCTAEASGLRHRMRCNHADLAR